MNKYRVEIEPPAWDDLESAYQWIADDSPESANRWYNRCIAAILTLAQFPERCPLAPEAKTFGLEIRHLIYGNHRIIYRIKGDLVEILHVRHQARLPIKPDPET